MGREVGVGKAGRGGMVVKEGGNGRMSWNGGSGRGRKVRRNY